MSKFEFLKEPFTEWTKEKQSIISNFKIFDVKKNTKEILSYEDIDITEIELLLEKLATIGPPSMMKAIFRRLSYVYGDFIPKNAPVLCDIELRINNFPNALRWTLVNIAELQFFDMSDIEFIEPFNQCRQCGQPNEFEHEKGIKKFNKKTKYCHNFNCKGLDKTDGSNPMLHENCCFGKFALTKKKLYQQMRATKRSEDEKIKLFLEYCDLQLQENEKNKWTIQAKNNPAIHEDNWYDIDLESL